MKTIKSFDDNSTLRAIWGRKANLSNEAGGPDTSQDRGSFTKDSQLPNQMWENYISGGLSFI